MNNSIGTLLKGSMWTLGAFGISTVLRFVTNIALARLLAPELFGLMLIVGTIRSGIELFSDLELGRISSTVRMQKIPNSIIPLGAYKSLEAL